VKLIVDLLRIFIRPGQTPTRRVESALRIRHSVDLHTSCGWEVWQSWQGLRSNSLFTRPVVRYMSSARSQPHMVRAVRRIWIDLCATSTPTGSIHVSIAFVLPTFTEPLLNLRAHLNHKYVHNVSSRKQLLKKGIMKHG
jgi:hypothetical protein